MTIGISPKLIAAVIAAMASYLIGQTVLELPPVLVVFIQLVTVASAAYNAGPGEVLPVESDDFGLADDVDLA